MVFIQGYKAILLDIEGNPSLEPNQSVLPTLVAGRAKLTKDPALLEKALERLSRRGVRIEQDLTNALRKLTVKSWIYLRDTKVHSIFMDEKCEEAYGVVGLTDRIRDITGGSGLFLESGVAPFCGVFVCDGLTIQRLWLGSNYKKSYNERLKELKSTGRFHTKSEA